MPTDDPDRSADPRSDGGTDLSRRQAENRHRTRADARPSRGGDVRSDPGARTDARGLGDVRDRSDHGDGATDGLWDATPTSETEGLVYDLGVYGELLDAFAARGYEFVGFDGAIEDGQIALRHDVDLSLERAAAMARLEADRGVRATYCLLVTTPLYDLLAPENREHVGEILAAGHDVGLHFDPHYYWDDEPPAQELEARVLDDRAALERAIDVAYAPDASVAATSIHQPPEWALGVDFDAFDSTYQPAYFGDVDYVSDSGGKWQTERPFTAEVPDALQLLVHPGMWGVGNRELSAILDHYREQCRERVERYVSPFGG